MTLQDYTTEELRAELKRRTDLVKAEKAKVKSCRMCKHWGEINFLAFILLPTVSLEGEDVVSFLNIKLGIII